jgi:hypothetical protein
LRRCGRTLPRRSPPWRPCWRAGAARREGTPAIDIFIVSPPSHRSWNLRSFHCGVGTKPAVWLGRSISALLPKPNSSAYFAIPRRRGNRADGPVVLVARLRERAAHVEPTVPGRLMWQRNTRSPYSISPGSRFVSRAISILSEQGGRHDHLEGGRGRVTRVDDAVQQWVRGIGEQALVFLARVVLPNSSGRTQDRTPSPGSRRSTA